MSSTKVIEYVWNPNSKSVELTTMLSNGQCAFSNKTKDHYLLMGYVVGSEKDFDLYYTNAMEQRFPIHKYVEIEEKVYYDMLECLPPKKWKTHDKGSIFMMCEYYTGDITSFYISHKEKYFTAQQVDSTPYNDIVQEIEKQFFK